MNDPYKKVSPSALIALKEALAAIYWYKKDLRSFITYTIKNSAIVSTIDWQNLVKYHAVSELVDRMAARPDLYHDDLLSLFREVANLTDFSHLKRCEDPEQKICTAQEKVRALQAHVRGHLDLLKEKEKAAQRRQEAQQKPVDAGDLYKIAGVLSGKLKNTLGLYISINGFSPECTAAKAEALKAMILMDGADLNAILDDRIDLHQMLYRKRRHASQTGNIYLPVDKILT